MKPLSKKLEEGSNERHSGEKNREREVNEVASKVSNKAGSPKGPSMQAPKSKGIKHGDAGRNLEDTEHHDRMGHTVEEY